MELWKKGLIVVGIAIVGLFVVPVSVAAATGKSEALKGLIETFRAILQAQQKTLDAILESYKEFLGAI